VKRFLGLLAVTALVFAPMIVQGPPSLAGTSIPREIAAGRLQAATLHVNGITKRLPSISGGVVATSQEMLGTPAVLQGAGTTARVSGAEVTSLGCGGRNHGRDVRVNQDCTYRRQAETHIAYNPTDPKNLVVGMNDSITGWNRTSLDFSLDGGHHWGAISTAPFGYRLNAPNTLEPTSRDPNSHTLVGGPGTLHSYDACSDPYVAFDSEGRAFYTCIAFDIATNASLVFAVTSPKDAKGSYFDQVPPPYHLVGGVSGREHIVVEDNSPAAFADGPKLAADSYPDSPNRDVVYETWTNFDQSCPPETYGYCESPIYGSMSTDHGFTWSTPEQISGANPAMCNYGDTFNPDLDPHSCNFNGHSDIGVLPSGDIVVSFENGNTGTVNQQYLDVHCHPTGSSPDGTASLNCGTPNKIADEVVEGAPTCDFGRGPEQCIPGAFIRAPIETSQRIAVDHRTGDVFDTWYDNRSGELDVWLSRSKDGGITWSTPRMVNADTGKDHYFPAVDIGETDNGSHVGIAYYRTARVPHESDVPAGGFSVGDPGVLGELSDVALAGGRDIATPFAFNVVSPRFPAPDGNQAGFNGDYIGLVVIGAGGAHPVWSDTRVSIPHPHFDFGTVDEDTFTIDQRLPG
jgi:hypothetical protein